VFTDEFEPVAGVRARAALLSHDTLGVAAFRFEVRATGRSLGYATDVGTASRDLIEHLAGVDVLAIESNYCPRMQAASNRPEFLKRRIMGGSGHLSNQESAEAVARIGPGGEVVLLHLSRQCNTPELAAAAHRTHGRPVTISKPDEPTGWIGVSREGEAATERVKMPRGLFEGVGR
jgi:phosphoribosyl 1,2-cyclic phosphodiesterase